MTLILIFTGSRGRCPPIYRIGSALWRRDAIRPLKSDTGPPGSLGTLARGTWPPSPEGVLPGRQPTAGASLSGTQVLDVPGGTRGAARSGAAEISHK